MDLTKEIRALDTRIEKLEVAVRKLDETLYQNFKARLIEEVAVNSPELLQRGMLIDLED